MSDKVQTKVYLPEELKSLVDADKRTNSEVIESALWSEFGGRKKSALEQRLEELDERITVVETEKENRLDELSELMGEKRGIESKLNEIENGVLTDEEQERAKEILESGERIFDVHDFVEEISEAHGLDMGTAHDAIRDTMDEYPAAAFQLSSPDEPHNWKDATDYDSN